MTTLGLDVAGLAQLVYDHVTQHILDAGVTLPDRRIIAGGDTSSIAWDCEQWVLTMPGIGRGVSPNLIPGNTKVGVQFSVAGLRHVKFDAVLVRCEPTAPNGEAPPAEQITTAGLSLLRDAGLMSQAMVMAASAITGGLLPGSQVHGTNTASTFMSSPGTPPPPTSGTSCMGLTRTSSGRGRRRRSGSLCTAGWCSRRWSTIPATRAATSWARPSPLPARDLVQDLLTHQRTHLQLVDRRVIFMSATLLLFGERFRRHRGRPHRSSTAKLR
jgi:hypothetical protein